MNESTHLINRRAFAGRGAMAAMAGPLVICGAAETAASDNRQLKVAVVTGGHPYDVPNFHGLFRSLVGADAYIQHMEDFATTPEAVRDQYDVVLFYHMVMPTPPAGPFKAVLEHLGATRQGIVVLHHALLAYPQWPLWSEIVGIADRKFGFHHDQRIRVSIANPSHAITRGLRPWEMTDETYTMADAGAGSDILLTTDHPKSMRTLAWTRSYRESRVFCYEGGHDNAAWANGDFRRVLQRGIQWSGRAIEA